MPTDTGAATNAIAAIDAAFRSRLETSEASVRRNKLYEAAKGRGFGGFIARVRRLKIDNEQAKRGVVNAAAILYANVPELQSVRITFAEPRHLVLEIQSVCGSWKKRYEYPALGLARHGVRSVAANLAFAIKEARLAPLKAEIGFVEGSDEPFKPTNTEKAAEEAVAFAQEAVAHFAPLREEAARRGIESPNPYGFQTTVEMKTASGQTCHVFFNTNNTNGDTPFFVFIENRGPVI